MSNNIKEFDVWVNSKAPMNEFGNMPNSTVTAIIGDNILSHTINNNIANDADIYHGDGDDAKFIPDETASSRLFMYMHVNTEKGIVSNVAAGSFGTENLKTHEHSIADPAYFAKMEKGTSEYATSVLGFGYSGGNPDKNVQVRDSTVHYAPDIDVQGQLRFSDDKNGDLLIQGEVNGDGFPATSVFADFGDKNKVMIASSPISQGATVYDLIGGADKRIMNINISVEFKDNIPVGIKDWNTMKSYSVEDWNKLHESTPMIESELSEEMIIDKGESISQVEVEKEFLASSSGIEINSGEEENTLDSTQKAQDIVANMNLPQYDSSMDYGKNDGIDMA